MMTMMTNLFTMFDPASSFISLSWTTLTIPIMLSLSSKVKSSKKSLIIFSFKNMFSSNIEPMLKKNSTILMKKIATLFILISLLNLSSLMPFNFTIASQILFSLPVALTLWAFLQLMGWTNYTIHMAKHLLPNGTPTFLIPLMILIEIISQLIRPITLSVRLTANMVAGHLLMSLMASPMNSSKLSFFLLTPISFSLCFLELCVSVIQAYVLTMLVTLYSTEIN